MAGTTDGFLKMTRPYLEMAQPYLDMAQPYLKMAQPYVDMAQPYVDVGKQYLEDARVAVNTTCSNKEAWQIIAITMGVTLIIVWIYERLFKEEESLRSRVVKGFFRNMKRIPFIRAKIQKEIDKTSKDLAHIFNKDIEKSGYMVSLPAKGMSKSQVMSEVTKYKKLAPEWSTGNLSGTVYNGDDDLTDFMAQVYKEFAWTNPLHADVFPDVRKMEAEVVKMTCTMFRGGPDSCGSMTSGGTESIMLACKAYRDRAYERGVTFPEIIAPVTVHAAFDKAASYFRMKITHIAINEQTRKVDVKAMKRAISKSTCMLVGSAPQFPHGVVDPIPEIGKLGVKYNIPVHVDSCLGGFLVPFMKKAGFHVDPFDFTLPGVTSISADTHKYGFAPKGSSVILYKTPDYRKYQYFVAPDWPGGIYASPTFAGSRAGAIIAACWATMVHIGEDGYVASTRKIIETTRYIEKGIKQIKGIFVFGKAEVSVVGLGSNDFNIFRLSDAMTAKGWNLNPLQFPSSIHMCVTLLTTKAGVADRFLKDVRDSVTEIMKDPKAVCGGQGAMYGMAQSIPDRSLVSEIAGVFWDAYYSTQTGSAVNGAAN